MHKKPLIAVLALGLLLLTTVSAFASEVDPYDGAIVRTSEGRSVQSKGTPSVEAASGTLVTINAGTNRTVPGTFCDGWWQGAFAYTVGGWYGGNEFYAAYQDPGNATWWDGGTCANSPSFDVTAINAVLRVSTAPYPKTFVFQPLVFGVASTAECATAPAPVAGGALCVGPMYAVTWAAAASYMVNLPFAIECCQNGPYFAAWYGPTTTAGLRLGCDAGLPADPGGPVCGVFNEYGGGWDELSKYFTWAGGPYNLEHILFSEGYTPYDPASHCTQGICDWQWHYVGDAADCGTGIPGQRDNDCWYTRFTTPSGSGGGRTKLATRFEAIGLDTLTGINFMEYGSVGTPNIVVEIYADMGDSRLCGPVPNPALGGLLYSVTIPWGTYLTDASPNYVPIPNITWGTLNGGLPQQLWVSLSVAPGTGTVYPIAYKPEVPGPGCGVNPEYSAGFYPAATFNGGLPTWEYLGQTPTASEFEFGIDAYICKEKVPINELNCGTGGPDVWGQWAHDARRTAASTINVGDPNGIVLSWTMPLPELNSFNSPTVINDRVYISSDKNLNCFDLATGALLGKLTGAPEMGSSNRGNATVDAAGNVYATGGNFNAISKLGPNLEASGFIWSNNTTNFSVPGDPPGMGLGAQNRFNTCVVANISGTDVVFVATEPAAGAGRLFAFNATTGALYGGWGNNPIPLDAACKHGPSYNAGFLYCGTAIGGTNFVGSLYKIDAATGVVVWNFTDVVGDGWTGGVSLEGNFLYGCTRNENNTGRRYKLDVTTNPPTVVWKFNEGLALYSAPTIGQNFVYIPQDNPAFGILMVDKTIGLAVANFAAEGVDMVPTFATLSCDRYLFAGDRVGKWWMLDTRDQTAKWYVQYPPATGIISGTALAHSSGGNDYAVIAIRQASSVGRVSAYILNGGPRPRLVQSVYDASVPVPFGANLTYTETGVFENIGNVAVNFTAVNVTDPLPDGLAAATSRATNRMLARHSLVPMDADYNQYFTDATLTKRQLVSGLSTATVDGEFMASDYNNFALFDKASNRSESRAAGAAALRISNVKLNGAAIPYALAVGAVADLTFDVNGSAPYLGRGIDLNIIQLTNDDPDFSYLPPHSVAEFAVTCVGGCLEDTTTLHFNDVPGGSAGRWEHVFNYGSLGDFNKDLNWNFDPQGAADVDLYDGSLVLVGDSIGGAAPLNALVRWQLFDNTTLYVGNSAPGSGLCGFDRYDNVLLGKKMVGGLPVDIYGEKVVSAFSDTNFDATAGSPAAAIGVNVIQTEVGAYDLVYGDFKVIRWCLKNLKATQIGPIFAGTYIDWDVNKSSGDNDGRVDDDINGYYIWDDVNPGLAFGALDPNQRSGYNGANPLTNPPYRIGIYGNSDRQTTRGWNTGFVDNPALIYTDVVNELPHRIYDDPGVTEDRAGILFHQPITLPGLGDSASVYQAIFGMPAHGGTPDLLVLQGQAKDIANRAARWSGFARGDVNDDGYINLGDVCWLKAGKTIYPANYCGDVNLDGLNTAADWQYLMAYVSAIGPAPLGAWRF